MGHVDYPHESGTLYDCPECESRCFCTPEGEMCIYDGDHFAFMVTGDGACADSIQVASEVMRWIADGTGVSPSVAKAIASYWQSPGPSGAAFAGFASTGSVEYVALRANLDMALLEAHREDDYFWLMALAAYARDNSHWTL